MGAGIGRGSAWARSLSCDLEHDLIEMPFVARSRQAATNLVGELLAKFARPLPYGLVADDDPAGGQQLLHHAKTEREAEIYPHGMAMISAGNRYPA
jgi:hypothetical protein